MGVGLGAGSGSGVGSGDEVVGGGVVGAVGDVGAVVGLLGEVGVLGRVVVPREGWSVDVDGVADGEGDGGGVAVVSSSDGAASFVVAADRTCGASSAADGRADADGVGASSPRANVTTVAVATVAMTAAVTRRVVLLIRMGGLLAVGSGSAEGSVPMPQASGWAVRPVPNHLIRTVDRGGRVRVPRDRSR